jgi:hypothetical protein
MPDPIVFISRSRILDGQLEPFRALFADGMRALAADNPGTVAQVAFASDDGTELVIVHVFPDADAFDRHLEGVAERSQMAKTFIATRAFEIFGAPSDTARAMMEGAAAASGITISFHAEYFGGFLRLEEGAPPGP